MSLRVDSRELERSAQLFLQPGCVGELRALDVSTPAFRQPHTEAGDFDEPAVLVKEAMRLVQHATSVYVTLNPVQPALLAHGQSGENNQGARSAHWGSGHPRETVATPGY